jgi:SP family galactose:H+ symporter-like MFS transporter
MMNAVDHGGDALPPSRSARTLIFLVTGTAALGGTLFGYDTGIISGALLFLKDEFTLSPNMQAVVTSAALGGAAVGAAFGGYLADRFGRKIVMLVLAAWFVIGSALCTVSHSVQMLIAGRAVLGCCIGIVSFVAPLYIAEVAPADRRGSLVSLNQLAITVGILVSYIVGYLFAGSGSWRWMVGLGAVPGVILGIGMWVLPESPRWLMKRARCQEARDILTKLRGATEVDREIAEIQAELDRERSDIGWSALFTPVTRRPLILGLGLAILQQTTGIGAVIYYAPTILSSMGFRSASSAILATSGIGLVNVLLTIVALRLIDHVGRRSLLLVGLAGMALSLGVFAVGFAFASPSSLFKWFAVGSMTAYVGFFAVGLGPVFWLLIAEIFPLMIRGRAMGIASMTIWVFNIMSALIFFQLLHWIGQSATFAGYAILTIAGWFFIFRYMPETRGLTLEQIEQYWTEHRPVARWAK